MKLDFFFSVVVGVSIYPYMLWNDLSVSSSSFSGSRIVLKFFASDEINSFLLWDVFLSYFSIASVISASSLTSELLISCSFMIEELSSIYNTEERPLNISYVFFLLD